MIIFAQTLLYHAFYPAELFIRADFSFYNFLTMRRINNFYHLLTVCLCLSTSSVIAQSNYIDKYVTETFTAKKIANSADGVDKPRDLDFKPNSHELWVMNKGYNNGGAMVVLYNAGFDDQVVDYRKDSHTGHFKIFPAAFAFGQDGFFANTNEIKSTAGPQSTFMGPALWSADTAIFARVFQSNWGNGLPLGSHYDMLHQSPFSMGIAHDSALVYWVNDGHNGNIVKYDFVKHHGPGYDDHSAGKIWRYTDVPVVRKADLPSHMVMDHKTGWLYFVDAGTKKVKRLDTRSGAVTGTLNAPNSGFEPLAGYWSVGGATVEEIAIYDGEPCGIDFIDNRLIVSDYSNGDIYLYNTETEINLVKKIETGINGIMGIKFGPDSKIWCVSYTDNEVIRLDISEPAVDVAVVAIEAPASQNFMANFYSTANNICNGEITPSVVIMNTGTSEITSVEFEILIDGVFNQNYTWNGTVAPGEKKSVILPVTEVEGGSHRINVNVINSNGQVDDVTFNNGISGSFRIITSVPAEEFGEDFSSTTFPPEGWNYIHYNPNNIMSRTNVGGFGNSTSSLKMDNFSNVENITGQVDYFMSPSIDFSKSSAATLNFSVAYAQYNASTNDKLEVMVSNDCGETWTTVFNKAGGPLSTALFATNSWRPTAANWRAESIDMTEFAGDEKVIVMFKTTSNFGNNLYIDDIALDNTVGNKTITGKSDLFRIYPNPTSGVVQIEVKDEIKNTVLNGKVFSADGRLIHTFDISSGSNESIDLSKFPPGMYAIQLSNATTSVTKSIIKN